MKKVFHDVSHSKFYRTCLIFLLLVAGLTVVFVRLRHNQVADDSSYDAETGQLFESLFARTEEVRLHLQGDQRAYERIVILELSTMLNHVMRKVGQLTCERTGQSQSAAGGWCSPFSGRDSSEHVFDLDLAKALSLMLQGKRIASFGDGPGIYKEKLLEWNQVASYDAFDGAPYVEQTTNKMVKFLELTVPVHHLSQYDWVVSLEVAEHIPRFYESIYVENLKRHAKEGIIMSWAQINQVGFMHVNNRRMDYVVKLIESSKEFKYDEDASIKLRNSAKFSWFKSNIVVFTKIEKSST